MIEHNQNKISAEFVILMALYVALMAMSIDMILPALGLMGKDLGVADENKMQYVIGALFLGFTFGQIIYGPISDSFGRKKPIYFGIGIFIIGNVICLTAENFEAIIFGRLLQGFGVAAPRVIGLAIVRDLYKGAEMARVMSFVMTIFILIPMVAPSLGQLILLVASWHAIFYVFVLCAITTILWTYFRLPETLHHQDIKPFNLRVILKDFVLVFKNKTTLRYSICAGLVFGGLIGYLVSSRQIFQDYFKVGEQFVLFFAMSALAIGLASIMNSFFVRKFSMKAICQNALLAVITLSALFFVFLLISDNQIAIWQFMVFIMIIFFCFGLLFGNLNALAMEPMGHYAGTASAVVGSLSSAISVGMGTLIGQQFNNSLVPIALGFFALSIAAFLLQLSLKKS